jgi:hypothetical protein
MLTNYADQPYGSDLLGGRKKDHRGNKLSSNTQVFLPSDILPGDQYRSKSYIETYRKHNLAGRRTEENTQDE